MVIGGGGGGPLRVWNLGWAPLLALWFSEVVAQGGEGEEGTGERPSASRGPLNAAKMTPALQFAACSCQTRVKVRGVHLPQTQQ